MMIVPNASPSLATDSFSSKNLSSVSVFTLVQEMSAEIRVMTPQAMVEILVEAAEESKVFPNRVMMTFRGNKLTCVYDSIHDRMRIIAPVAAHGDFTD
ncbi:MAG: hypothetical protein G3M70_04860 [Candidatus Nitronauta litoralis]|uniref:Uncharacterized protein n=1 Tax=Candidatus Nitronauta litoralis TaxID=2705533 RepID=A0A7T0BUT8_9BACT|nr:MAG: hypothetical protein G3M70_04860 [Candidatus Nitronauta litoralis]